MSKREEVRIGATLAFAVQKVQENLAEGKQIRQDDFFQDQPGERAAAAEILEGVLLVAQREYQEKKLRFYGNLLANIAFSDSVISRDYANLLIRVGESLSYRQLCLLQLFIAKEQFGLRRNNYSDNRNVGAGRYALLQEIYDLCSKQMLDGVGPAMLSLFDITPSAMGPIGTGVALYNLMELWLIDPQDLEQVASLLR